MAAPAREWSSGSRRALFVIGLATGAPLLAFAVFVLLAPPSLVGGLFAIAIMIWCGGALTAPWRKVPRVCTIAIAMMVALIGWRSFDGASGAQMIETVEPASGNARILDRILPERDVALAGTRALVLAGAMNDQPEVLLSALRDGYSRMEEVEGGSPSPIVGTFVSGQSAGDFTMLRIAPRRFEPPDAAVVFLHGFIGNVALECWQVAQAALPLGMETVCPSTEWQARWARPDGIAIVDRTITALRTRGIRRVYLAGLSAGAIGASRIAHHFDLQGVILISGASPGEEHVKQVPTLVLQGRLDPRTPPGPSRAYAQRLGSLGTYREWPDASHWLILSHHEQVRETIQHWLMAREGLSAMEH